MTTPTPVDGYDQIPPLDIRGLARVIWYGKWVIAVVTAAAVAAGLFYAFEMTRPLYAATATLELGVGRAHGGQADRAPGSDPVVLNTIISQVSSDAVLDAVISRLSLLDDPEFNRYLIAPSPLSPRVLRAALRDHLSGVPTPVPDALAIHHKTIENLRARLRVSRTSDTYLVNLTASSGTADKAMLLANTAADTFVASQIVAQNAASGAGIAWLADRVDTLRAQRDREDRAVLDLIQTVQVHEDTSLDRLGSAVLALDEERAALTASLASLEADGALTARQEAAMRQLRSRLSDTNQQRARLQDQLWAQSSGLIALQQMQRTADETQVLLQSFEARLQEARLQDALAEPQSRVVAPAATVQYVGPRKTLIVKIAAVLGILGGLSVVIFQHMARRGAYHPAQLAHDTGRPVFGHLPAHSMRRVGGTSFKQLLSRIQAGLMLQSREVCPQVIMTTSSDDSEGSAFLAASIARDLEGRTLLIVTNPDSRAVGRLWRRRPPRSTGPHCDQTLGCDVSLLNGPQDLLAADFGAMLQGFRATYAHIVILAPPVLTAPEALLCAQKADAVIYAVRWAKTPVETVCQGLALLAQASAVPTGLILTKTKPRKMQRFAAMSALPAAYLTSTA